MKVLDVGCGDNISTFPLKGKNVIHIDICINDFNKPIVNVKSDCHFLPFQNESFELVYCSHVLEHCYNPLAVLKELKRVSRKKVIIKVPSWKSSVQPEAPEHLYTWTSSTLQHLLNVVFSDVKVYKTNRRFIWITEMPFMRRTFQMLIHVLVPTELTGVCYK